MNKNTVLGWATFLMIIFGLALVILGLTKYKKIFDIGIGFIVIGAGFFAIAWVFNALKGRV
tara:strand:+ start:502 stop:684 length:183 start_codon:yes stop_codon:yes gene_type:complete